MRHGSGGPGGRGTAFGLVLLAHAAILWALLQVRPSVPHGAALERLTLIYLPAPNRNVPAATPAPAAPKAPRPAPYRPPDAQGAVSDVAHDTVPDSAGPRPPIDWTAEQRRAAELQAPQIWKQLSAQCRDAFARHVYPPDCHRYVAPEPWEPEEKRFGFEGPLPYVRLGQCVVGLGFWGCAVGKRPPPDGTLFDRMRGPDRPGATPGNGGYQAAPDPRERLH